MMCFLIQYTALVSTHSSPKAAGKDIVITFEVLQFEHTAARRRLEKQLEQQKDVTKFQHTAARRRLGMAVMAQFG